MPASLSFRHGRFILDKLLRPCHGSKNLLHATRVISEEPPVNTHPPLPLIRCFGLHFITLVDILAVYIQP